MTAKVYRLEMNLEAEALYDAVSAVLSSLDFDKKHVRLLYLSCRRNEGSEWAAKQE